METSQLYGLITVIILIILGVSIWYLSACNAKTEIVLSRKEGIFQTTTFFGTAPLEPMGTHFFESDDTAPPSDTIQDRMLVYDEAIVVYGEIPRDYLYWGLSGQSREPGCTFASVGDSVSSSDYKSLGLDDYVAAIMTTNPKMYDAVARSIRKEFAINFPSGKLSTVAIMIPSSVYSVTAKYAIVSHSVLRKPNDVVPTYKCRLYKGLHAVATSSSTVEAKIQSKGHHEQATLANELWEQSTRKVADKKQYTVIREVDVHPHTRLSTATPLRLDNRDVTSFVSDAIQLAQDETIVVVAADHALSGKAMYSNVSFCDVNQNRSYVSYTTGDATVKKHSTQSSISALAILDNPSQLCFVGDFASIRITESLYVEPKFRVGPHPDTVLRMRIFVINKVAT